MTAPVYRKNQHCSYCGQAFALDQLWPRLCENCSNISYINPTPVSVVLLPIDSGLLCVRRGIPPCKGHLALPGGFIDHGESWRQAGSREVFEETGLQIQADSLSLFDVVSAPNGVLLVFALAPALPSSVMNDVVLSEETTECVIIAEPMELAFPIHTAMMRRYFQR